MLDHKGTLFIVSTPIGNLQDITVRAIKTLYEADIIACEDTRHLNILLRSIEPIYKKLFGETLKDFKLISYYEQNEERRIPQLLNFLINGFNVALVCDAGTPLVSDPGFKLIRECVRQAIKIVSVPGPSSPIAALTISGLPTDKFLFVGYPPRKKGHREKFLEKLNFIKENFKTTVILLEAPHKIINTLNEFKNIIGDIDIVVVREITKIYEEVKRGKVSEIIEDFGERPPKGEFIILFNCPE